MISYDVLLIFIANITSASPKSFKSIQHVIRICNHFIITTDDKHVIYVQTYNDISMFYVFDIHILVTLINLKVT